MTLDTQVSSAARLMRIIHLSLTAGPLVAAGLLFYLRRITGGGPQIDAPGLALGLAVAGVALAAFALAVLRSREPDGTPEKTPDAFWSDLKTRGRAIALWAVLESAALIGLVGYYLTGALAPLAASGIAIGALVLMRPARFEE